MKCTESRPVDLFGFRFDVGLDPIEVNLERMLASFHRSCEDLCEVWALALAPDTYEAVRALGRHAVSQASSFRLDDDLWTRVVLDFACAHRRHQVARSHLLKSLTPLYLARVASFVNETRSLVSTEVEDRIERLCRRFESEKPYLRSRWEARSGGEPEGPPAPESREARGTGVEVKP